jgi:hypothetical protein
MFDDALRLTAKAKYLNAGTVEFLVDKEVSAHYYSSSEMLTVCSTLHGLHTQFHLDVLACTTPYTSYELAPSQQNIMLLLITTTLYIHTALLYCVYCYHF